MRYQNIRSASFSFVTIHTSDGQTDRIAKAIPCIALHAAWQKWKFLGEGFQVRAWTVQTGTHTITDTTVAVGLQWPHLRGRNMTPPLSQLD